MRTAFPWQLCNESRGVLEFHGQWVRVQSLLSWGCAMGTNKRFHALEDQAPCIEAAILNWYSAFRNYRAQPSREHQGEYCRESHRLGQSISRWQAQQPELVQQFGYWFDSHREVWFVQEPDTESGL